MPVCCSGHVSQLLPIEESKRRVLSSGKTELTAEVGGCIFRET